MLADLRRGQIREFIFRWHAAELNRVARNLYLANTALLHLNQHIARCKLRIEEKFVNCVDRRGRQICFQQDLKPLCSRLFNDLPLDQFFQLLNIIRSQRVGGKTGIVYQIPPSR